jgi:hypothetical protein
VQAAQWGWLHSKPDRYNDTRQAMFGGEEVGIDRGIEGQYLMDVLFAVGPEDRKHGGEITWLELRSYCGPDGDWLQWELDAVMAMSRAYHRAKQEGKDVHCIAPVDREET